MDFKELVGQEKIIKHLRISIEQGRVAHAYAFDGPEGIGKLSTAMAFAKALLCRNYKEDSCNTCVSCSKVNNGNHPDLQIIEPDGHSIKNKQIEDFQQDLMRKPYESPKKVYIIKRANEMTVSAQNRLLKTLEEPPEYGVIILISTNSNGFLPTIKSRCQIIKFHRVHEKTIENFLRDRYKLEAKRAQILSIFSHGIVGNALKLMESEDFNTRRQQTIQVIEELLEGDKFKVFEMAEFFSIHKEYIDEILDLMILWFRDILLLKETGSERFLINLDKKATLQKHLNHVAYEKISNIIGTIEKTKNELKANVNFQLAVEMMLFSIQEV